jgi:hypothetical protein
LGDKLHAFTFRFCIKILLKGIPPYNFASNTVNGYLETNKKARPERAEDKVAKIYARHESHFVAYVHYCARHYYYKAGDYSVVQVSGSGKNDKGQDKAALHFTPC